MLLKLVLGGHALGRHDSNVGQIERAAILKWHKTEGDWVDYGDDLLDMEVEAIQSPANKAELQHEIELLNTKPSRIAELAARQLAGEALSVGDIDPEVLEPRELYEWTFTARITSSDAGVLRRICAPQGQRRTAGDVLAVLATEPGEVAPISEQALGAAGGFRTVINEVTSAWDPEP
jgi:multidrug efflux pump subunit AcrA (membrane-fusion protein)